MTDYQIEIETPKIAEIDDYSLNEIKLTDKLKDLLCDNVDIDILQKLEVVARLLYVACERDDKELFYRMDKMSKDLLTKAQEQIDSKKDQISNDDYLWLCAFTKTLYN